eukprot:910414-Pyramimonas_sp.AAC.1
MPLRVNLIANCGRRGAPFQGALTDRTRGEGNNTSFYGSSCANNGKDALNTPEALYPEGMHPCRYWHRRTRKTK